MPDRNSFITPPTLKRFDGNNGYHSRYIDNVAGMYPGVFKRQFSDGSNGYGAEIQGFPLYGGGWKTIDTPFGSIRGGLSDDQVLGFEVMPNESTQAYINALANLLKQGGIR